MLPEKVECLEIVNRFLRAQFSPCRIYSVSVILTHKQTVAMASRNRYTYLLPLVKLQRNPYKFMQNRIYVLYLKLIQPRNFCSIQEGKVVP